MLGRTIHHDLDATDVGLPGSVGTSVRMGLTDTENHSLAADFTLCHVCTSFEDDIIGLQHPYSIRFYEEKQALF